MHWAAVFILGISPGEFHPEGKRKGRRGSRRGRTPGNFFIPPGARSLEYRLLGR